MPQDKFIETGVDKLVRLVESKKKISTREAAKMLSVSVAVIDEWADFLEEEGLISIEYKLATTYLVERKLSKKEIVKKAKEFSGTKEAFVRKIETEISGIEHDTHGLDDIKEQFLNIKREIGDDLNNVKEELRELENYEKIKKNIDRQIYNQQREFRKKINEMEKEIFKEKSRYKELIDDIDVETIKLKEEKTQMLSLREKEARLLSGLENFKKTITELRDKIKQEEDKVEVTEDHINYLEKLAEKIKDKIASQREKLNPLAEESRKQEANITKVQEEVLKKVVKGRKKINAEVADSEKVSKQFKLFFERKAHIDKLLDKVSRDKDELESEMRGLIKKAQAFDLASKSSSVKDHMAELNKKLKEIDNKRSIFKKELSKLIGLVRKNF